MSEQSCFTNGSNSLSFAVLIIAQLPMDEQERKIDDVEVGDDRVETGRKRPRQGHQKVAPGVDVSKGQGGEETETYM